MTAIAEPTVVRDFTLAELEEVIESGLMTFVEVGQALMRIRDGKLYRAEYGTFQEYCTRRWGFDRTYAHRLMRAGEISEMLPIGNKPANEAQARALAPLRTDPPKMLEAMEEAQAETGGKVTTDAVERAVEKRAPRSAKPARPISPARKSVSSRADASDFADDAPDYTDQSQDTGDFDVNNEAGPGAGRSRFCSLCGPGDHRSEDCAYATGDPFDGANPHPDGVSPPIGPDPALLNEPAPPTDRGRTEAREVSPSPATDAAGAASEPAATVALPDRPVAAEPGAPQPPAAPAVPNAPGYTTFSPGVGKSAGKGGSHGGRTSMFTDRTLDAGQLARALFDMPTAQIIEAIAELDTSSEKRLAIREAFGGTSQPAPAPVQKPDLREALGDDGCTVLALSAAIGETFTVDARMSLLALLADADDIPAERLAPLAGRINVRLRNVARAEPTGRPVWELEQALITELGEPERIGDLAKRLLKSADLATVKSLEATLPMLRKEVGQRERALAATGSR